MQRDPRVYLLEAVRAGERIQRFIDGKTLTDYETDELLHSAVERQFEILGEALRQFAVVSPDTVESLESHRRVVACRNQLAHGYFAIQHDVVWAVRPPICRRSSNSFGTFCKASPDRTPSRLCHRERVRDRASSSVLPEHGARGPLRSHLRLTIIARCDRRRGHRRRAFRRGSQKRAQ